MATNKDIFMYLLNLQKGQKRSKFSDPLELPGCTTVRAHAEPDRLGSI